MALTQRPTVAGTQGDLNLLFPAPAPVPEFVGIFDIGTGNLHAVFDADGRPFLYCDLGGGALGSTFTFPEHLTLCTNRPPLVLLSHFDQDHWRSAVAAGVGINRPAFLAAGAGAIHPDAALCTWLVPNQAKGLVQAAFFNCLVAATPAVHERPNVTPGTHLTIGPRVTIIKCTGHIANDSGLALMLHAAAGAGRMILPGDSQFNFFAHGAGGNVDAIVATHHGADPVAVPAASAAGGSIAYSFGWGNAYGFPRLAAGAAYTGQAFADANRMDTAGAEGAADVTGPRGNVALRWPGQWGEGRDPGALALAPAVQSAALAVLAASAAALQAEGLALPAPIPGQIAAAAAWQALMIHHAAPNPAAALFLAGPVGAAPAALIPAAPPAAQAWLTAADNAKMDATNYLTGAGIPAEIARIAQVLRVAHEALAPVVSYDAWNAWGNGGNIQSAASPARAAAYAAMDVPGNGGVAAQAAVALHLGPAPYPNALDTSLAAHAVPAICRAARRAHSLPGSHARRPPSAAARVAANLVVAAPPLTDAHAAALAAGAAMQPGIATNPEAPNGILALLLAERTRVEDAMRIAIAAAMAGVNAAAAVAPAPPAPVPVALIARAAVAAAMAARGAASGAPQPGCHRHPSTCGANVCQLALHYAP